MSERYQNKCLMILFEFIGMKYILLSISHIFYIIFLPKEKV